MPLRHKPNSRGVLFKDFKKCEGGSIFQKVLEDHRSNSDTYFFSPLLVRYIYVKDWLQNI